MKSENADADDDVDDADAADATDAAVGDSEITAAASAAAAAADADAADKSGGDAVDWAWDEEDAVRGKLLGDRGAARGHLPLLWLLLPMLAGLAFCFSLDLHAPLAGAALAAAGGGIAVWLARGKRNPTDNEDSRNDAADAANADAANADGGMEALPRAAAAPGSSVSAIEATEPANVPVFLNANPAADGAAAFASALSGARPTETMETPGRRLAWGAAFFAGGVGLAMVVFAARVAPLPEREGLPPREADLLLRWEQVFAARPGAKTTGGIARVLAAPRLLPEMEGASVYCSLGNPLPPELLEAGAVFRARGVLDTTRHYAAESAVRVAAAEARAVARREKELGKAAAAQQSLSAPAANAVSAATTTAVPAAANANAPAAVASAATSSSASASTAASSSVAASSTAASSANVSTAAARGGRPDGFARYLEGRRAVSAFTRGRVLEVVSAPPPVTAWCAAQRERLSGVLARGLDDRPEAAALYSAILLGQTSGVERAVRDDFSRTGTAHLFSVSGLHVGVISAVLFWLGRIVRAPGALWRMVVIVVMFVFVMITGGSPAALRAWLMVSCILAARLFSRRGGPGAGLALAATGALLHDPALLLDAGFQLSYGIVAALVFYGIPLTEFLRERWRPWRDLPPRGLGWLRRAVLWFLSWLAGGVGVGAASTLAGAPLVLHHFSLFSAGSMFANLVVVPLSFPVMLLGFGTVALGVCGAGALALPLNWVAGWNLQLVAWVVAQLSRVPGMALDLEYRVPWGGPLTAAALLLLFLLLPLPRRPRGWVLLVPPAFLALALLLLAKPL